VRLLDDDYVAEPVGRARPGPHPQVLDDPDDQRADEERLVLVVGDVLDGQHDVAAQQRADVGRVPPSKKRPADPVRSDRSRTPTNRGCRPAAPGHSRLPG